MLRQPCHTFEVVKGYGTLLRFPFGIADMKTLKAQVSGPVIRL